MVIMVIMIHNIMVFIYNERSKKKKFVPSMFYVYNIHYVCIISCSMLQGYSCVDLLNAGMRDSGVYYLQIRGTTYWFLKVYCEQDIAEGGWTVSNSFKEFF